MINVNDFKVGVTIEFEGNLYLVLSFGQARSGKRSANVKAKLKNLRTGAITEYSFNSGVKVPLAHVSKRKATFSYATGEVYSFMDSESYETLDINKSQLGDDVKYLKDGLELILIFFENELLGVELPEKIDYKITTTEPAIKGNTATNATKDAYVETGMLVRVPLFIDQGEEIIVSTKDGKYVSRK